MYRSMSTLYIRKSAAVHVHIYTEVWSRLNVSNTCTNTNALGAQNITQAVE